MTRQVWSVCRLLTDYLCLNLFPQRGECGRSLLGGSEEDLPEHPRWQSGPECCRVGSPAQTVCTSGRSPQRRQPAGQRRLQLLTRDRNFKPDGRTETDTERSLFTRLNLRLHQSHHTGFRWIIFHISVLTWPKQFSPPIIQTFTSFGSIRTPTNSRISQLAGPLCLS